MTAVPQTTSRRRAIQIGLALYVLALALRLGVLMEVRDHPTIVKCTVLDMRGNHEFALSILEGLRPTTFYKAPLYTYFIAAVYALTGPDPFNVRVVQIVLVSFIPVLTFLIGRFFFGQLVGAIGGVLAAVFWTFLYFSVELLDTELACLIYMTLAYLLLVLEDDRWTKWAVCGVLLGLGAITRPNILAFAPVLAITVLIVGLRRVRRAAEHTGPVDGGTGWRRLLTPLYHVMVLTAACCAAIAPVTLRNRIVGGEWVLIGAYGGMNFYVANSPYSDSKDGPLLVDESALVEPTTYDPNEPWARCCLNYYLAYRVAETELGHKPTPGEFSSVMGQKGMAFLRDNPGWLVRHAIRRVCWLFNTYEFHSNRDFYHFRKWSRVLTIASGLQFGMICPFALVGLALALSRRDLRTAPMAYYVGMLASLALPAVLFIINARFRLPVVHLLMPPAAYGLMQFVGRFRRGVRWSRRVRVIVPLAGLVVFSNVNLFGYWDSLKAHLRWAMVIACENTGRDDLLPDAVKDFEQALAEDLKHLRPSNTAEVLKYANPMTWLFRYYDRLGDRAKALEYARRMLEDEQFNPQAVTRAFDLFVQVGDRQWAMRSIERMSRWMPPGAIGDALRAFAEAFDDRAALIRAKQQYELAVQLQPAEAGNHRALEEIRKLLAVRGSGTQATTSRAAGSLSAP